MTERSDMPIEVTSIDSLPSVDQTAFTSSWHATGVQGPFVGSHSGSETGSVPSSSLPPVENRGETRDAEPDEGSPGELGDGSREKSAEGSEPQSGEPFGADAAVHDLQVARAEVRIIVNDLKGAGGEEPVVRAVRAEADLLLRQLDRLSDVLGKGGTISASQACSVILRVEIVREAAKDAADHADGNLKMVLKDVLRKVPIIGQKLLSMSLHLFPVREWSLGGEVSALFVKGNISVTFGK